MIARSCLRKWTFESVLCYKRGCVCSGCTNNNLETRCRMKEVVFALINKFGAPKGVIDGCSMLYDPNTRILREEG